jgi:acyl-[acyl-carrier-protein]-phospholipid O-acyltransferase / long-chain-fatty-acid--[acyl-carrier-protein] ligase
MRDCKSKSFKAFLTTLFLGAFNDNVYKLLVILIAIQILRSPEATSLFTSLAGLLFIVPFFFFSAWAGSVTDRIGKIKMIRVTKFAEIIIMALTFLAFRGNSLVLMCAILFLMASQSAFFGPAKYGIIPELVDENYLSAANGYTQMWTFVAIILGTAFAGALALLGQKVPLALSVLLVLIAASGLLAAFQIKETAARPAAQPEGHDSSFRSAVRAFKHIKNNRPLLLTFLAINYFWFLGAVFQMNGILYIKNILSLNNTAASILLSLVSVGVACGSLLAGELSDKKVEFGLVPLGASLMCFFLCLLGLTYESVLVAASALFFLGVSAGFYIVPLNAFYQKETPPAARGMHMANLNMANALAIICASLFIFIFGTLCRFNPAHLFLLLGAATIGASVYIIKTLPDSLVRLVNWTIAHSLYKISVVDSAHVPKKGGALIVCNHVSYADPALVLAALERPVRFLMFRQLYDVMILKPIARAMRAIPVAFNDRPKKILASLEEARAALIEGDIVCIFAEGGLTRTGNLQPFHKGFERITKGVDVPIIPLYIDRIWGSIFSFERGRYFWKWPRKIPYPVTLHFGAPLPADAKAHEVRLRVQELSSATFLLRGKNQQKLQMAFIDQTKKRPLAFCIADSGGTRFNYLEALTGMLLLARHVFKDAPEAADAEQYVGVLLPASTAASIANGAVLYAGKIPVNLNFTASQESCESSLTQCGIRRIITSRKFIEKMKFEKRDSMVFLEDVKAEISAAEKRRLFLTLLFTPAFLIKRLFAKGDIFSIDETATIIFSSGSTGEPKGIMLSHRNIFSNIEGLYQILGVQKNDVIMGVLPFFHSFGFTATLCFPVGVGVSAVYHTNPMDAATIGKTIHAFQATHLMATPTFLTAYLRKCTPEQCTSLRYVVTGAEKLKESLAVGFKEKFGLAPFEGYGATELSPIVSMGVPDYINAKAGIRQTGNKPASVGHPIPGVAVKIVDPETGGVLPPLSEGLLMVKGPNVMKGYLNDPEKTAAVLTDGWYNTGDLAFLDTDGFIHIIDRLSRFSKIGGEMVPHIKVETEILDALETSEQLCVVTSVADEQKGERLVVLYTGDIDINTLWQTLSKRDLPKLWIPKQKDFFHVETIPVLGSGKLDLKAIKQIAAERTQQDEE